LLSFEKHAKTILSVLHDYTAMYRRTVNDKNITYAAQPYPVLAKRSQRGVDVTNTISSAQIKVVVQ
jgi:hypothetical protein